MEAPAKSKHLRLHAGIALALAAIPVAAQQTGAAAQLPDYAAVLGTTQVVRDPATGTRRGLNQKEVQQRLDAEGVERSSAQRQQSRAVNEMIHAQPATIEEAFRTAKPNEQGILVVMTSREEIEPVIGLIGPDGGMQASHDPADLRRDEP